MTWVELVREINFANQILSVPVTISVANADPVTTRGIWMTTVSQDMPPGTDFSRREPLRVMAIRRDAVPSVPRGTVIVAPEAPEGEDENWVVDGHERQEVDHHRVIMRRQTADEG